MNKNIKIKLIKSYLTTEGTPGGLGTLGIPGTPGYIIIIIH